METISTIRQDVRRSPAGSTVTWERGLMGYTIYWPTIAGLFLGVLLIAVGYSLRSRSLGVFLLWLGQAGIVAVILVHIVRMVSN